MEIPVNNKIFIVISFVFLLTVSANAVTCSKSYTIGFFNGVWNTSSQATDGAKELKELVGETYNNEPIKYTTFYNHTGASIDATPLQDLAETFIQRSAEIDASGELGRRFEYFWEFIGSSEPTFIDKIKGIFSNAIALFDSLYTAINTKLVAIISYFTSNPPTETDYATHNAKLDTLAADGQKLMLVGHSQGNLFMNHAYDHILPVVTKDRVATAHIAPASPTLRGDWVLANIDLVINALRIQGVNSAPDNNLDINASRVDVSGHTLIGTYLDPTRDGRAKVKMMIEMAMGKLTCPFLFESLCVGQITGDINSGSYLLEIINDHPFQSSDSDLLRLNCSFYSTWKKNVYYTDFDPKTGSYLINSIASDGYYGGTTTYFNNATRIEKYYIRKTYI